MRYPAGFGHGTRLMTFSAWFPVFPRDRALRANCVLETASVSGFWLPIVIYVHARSPWAN
ncbi:Hypothetical predicted protein, partial [Olea europaea subsp. europaea]